MDIKIPEYIVWNRQYLTREYNANNIHSRLDIHKHVAIIFSTNGRMCAIGYNMYNSMDKSEHAEYRAIKNLQARISCGKLKAKNYGFYMIVVRVHFNQDNFYFLFSRPCKQCSCLLSNQHFIDYIYWSTNNHNFDGCKVKSLLNFF